MLEWVKDKTIWLIFPDFADVIIVCDRVELYLSWIEQMRPALFEDYETPEAEHATVATSATLGA